MDYKKPACACGTELIVNQHVMQSASRKILKNGMLAKGTFDKTEELHRVNLCCPKCYNTYELEFDEGGKVYRGSH